MATPIRWDNIHRMNSPAEASQPLEAAQRSFQGAFSSLGNILASREAMEAANFQNTRLNNTTAFLDQIAQYRTPESLRAAQESGAIDQLRQQYGTQIDAGAVRGAADARLAALQGQAQQNIAYEGVMRNEATAPLVDRLRNAIQTGDKVGEAAARQGLSEAGYRDFATQNQFANAWAQQIKEQGRGDIRFTNEQTLFGDTLKTTAAQRAHMAAQDANAAAQLGISREQVGLQREQMNLAKEDRLVSQLQKQVELLGNSAKATIGSAEGQAKIADYIDKLKDPDIQDNARQVFTRLLKKDPNTTVAGALAGVSSVQTRWGPDWGLVGNAVDTAETFMKSEPALSAERQRVLANELARRGYTEADARLKSFRESVYPKKPEEVKNPFR